MRVRLSGVVERIAAERNGAQEIVVRVGEERRNAINYPDLTGQACIGDLVMLNTWAVEMGLGTGGFDFVVAIASHTPNAPERKQAERSVPTPEGHILKLRYTPLQHPVLAAEAPESRHHAILRNFTSLGGTPVVCAELHSQIPAIAAAAKTASEGAARVVYVMTEGAALPLAFSRLVPAMREKGWIDATVTAGQAFGGDYEAINLYSALAVAKAVAKADVIVVGQGPGNAGTDTPLGFSGIDQGVALNAAEALEGTPIVALRLSFADRRERHYGLSHHTLTVLKRVALCRVLAPLPRLPVYQSAVLYRTLIQHNLLDRHLCFPVDAEAGLNALLDARVEVTTMGRGIQEERPFFLAAAAAGYVAGLLTLRGRE